MEPQVKAYLDQAETALAAGLFDDADKFTRQAEAQQKINATKAAATPVVDAASRPQFGNPEPEPDAPIAVEGAAVKAAGIMKRVTPHTLRHAFVTHALQNGNDIATVKDLVGHEDVNTTLIYAHGDAARGVSPLDGVARVAAPEVHFLMP